MCSTLSHCVPNTASMCNNSFIATTVQPTQPTGTSTTHGTTPIPGNRAGHTASNSTSLVLLLCSVVLWLIVAWWCNNMEVKMMYRNNRATTALKTKYVHGCCWHGLVITVCVTVMLNFLVFPCFWTVATTTSTHDVIVIILYCTAAWRGFYKHLNCITITS